MSGAANLLVVEDLAKSYGGVEAVSAVSLAIPRGSLTGLIGPNGAGKSTVLGMIAGAITPDRGSIRIDGAEIAGLPSYRVAGRGVTRTFQAASVFPHLTVIENLLLGVPPWAGEGLLTAVFARSRWGHEEREHLQAAERLLDRLALTPLADSYAEELSGGQKRLVEIGRALMSKPRLLLLDEPMAGVSRTLAPVIEGLIGELRDEGLTVLLIEHELMVVERLCSPVIVMAQGRVLMQGEMEECRADPEVRRAYLVG
ncbi:MAG: ABC transporter ATP-binding protein [Acidobacteriota bacterium]|nr:ABC transporter ATP-binding protein [Acidobacteriota bacterium]